MSKEVRYDDVHIVHVVIDFVMFTAIQKRFRIPDRFRLLSGRKGHLNEIRPVTPNAKGCEDCLKIGDSWIHLQLMPELPACRLLRFLQKQACDQALS